MWGGIFVQAIPPHPKSGGGGYIPPGFTPVVIGLYLKVVLDHHDISSAGGFCLPLLGVGYVKWHIPIPYTPLFSISTETDFEVFISFYCKTTIGQGLSEVCNIATGYAYCESF